MVYRAIRGNLAGPVTVCPKQAAREFFAAFPLRRKCCIISGTHAAGSFIPAPYEPGRPPEHYAEITRGNIETIGARGNV